MKNPPKTSPPKTDSKKTSTVNTVITTVHRHSSPTKNTLKIKLLDPNTQIEPHFEEHLTEGSCSYHKPCGLQPTERAQHKTQKPTWVKEVTPDLESKVIGPPDYNTKLAGYPSPGTPEKNQIKSNKDCR